jgi:hypothetical protein
VGVTTEAEIVAEAVEDTGDATVAEGRHEPDGLRQRHLNIKRVEVLDEIARFIGH